MAYKYDGNNGKHHENVTLTSRFRGQLKRLPPLFFGGLGQLEGLVGLDLGRFCCFKRLLRLRAG